MSARTAGPQSRTSPNRCVVSSGGDLGGDLRVEQGVEPRDRRPRQGARDRQIAVQVEEVALVLVQRVSGPGTTRMRSRCPWVANTLSPGRTPVSTTRSRPSRPGLTSRMCVDPSAKAPISANAAIRRRPPVVVGRPRRHRSRGRRRRPRAAGRRGPARPAADDQCDPRCASASSVIQPGSRDCASRRSMSGDGRAGIGHADEALIDVPAPALDHRRGQRQPLRSRIGRAMSGLSTTNANIARSPQRPRNRCP